MPRKEYDFRRAAESYYASHLAPGGRGREGSAGLDDIEESVPKGTCKYDGEFDPGSERTLAARFKHASRTGK